MKPESKVSFQRRMRAITLLDGFTAEMKEESLGWGERVGTTLVFVLTKPDDTEIKFDQGGSGHTRFNVEGKGWFSFDRIGVEDSFYHAKLYEKDPNDCDLNRIVAEQLTKIAERREYHKSAVPIPGIPFTVPPDGVAGLKARLRTHGFISFFPSGFGAGYTVTKKPTRRCQFGETRAKPETETFFGISPLYVHTLDCD